MPVSRMRLLHDTGGGTASGVYIRSAAGPCGATRSANYYCLRGGEGKTALDSWPAELSEDLTRHL